MAQGVTYADLRFVRSPPGKKVPQPGTGAEDGELTYENIQGSRPHQTREPQNAPKEEAGSGRWSWKAGLAVLTATLLLLLFLLLATAIGLGVRYWQVSGQLLQASQAHAELSSAQEGSLAQAEAQLHRAKEELNSTQEALRRSQEATRKAQEQLQEALEEANRTLEALKKKEEELQRATSCPQTGCCPSGWRLFRWRCLWVSEQEKNWEDSNKDCEKRASRLLIPKEPLETRALWEAEIPLQSYPYWIGLKKEWSGWVWSDDSHFSEGLGLCSKKGNCGQLRQESLLQCYCGGKSRYICEQPASPTQVAQAP